MEIVCQSETPSKWSFPTDMQPKSLERPASSTHKPPLDMENHFWPSREWDTRNSVLKRLWLRPFLKLCHLGASGTYSALLWRKSYSSSRPFACLPDLFARPLSSPFGRDEGITRDCSGGGPYFGQILDLKARTP